MVPDESHGDVSLHGFCKWGATALFDMQMLNLDAGSYLFQTPAKALVTVEKEKKYKYLQPCLEFFCCSPMVYSADVITGIEAVVAHRRLSLLLRNKIKREYSEMCSFTRTRMSLEIVISNTILLQGTRYKEAFVRHIPDMADGALMALLAPCRV